MFLILPHKEDLVGRTKKLGLPVDLGSDLSSRDLIQMDLFYYVGEKQHVHSNPSKSTHCRLIVFLHQMLSM